MASVTIGRISEPNSFGVSSSATQGATAAAGETATGDADRSDQGAATSLTTGSADNKAGPRPTDRRVIQVADSPDVVKPFQTVRIQGRYHGGADALVHVERWQSGAWLQFPLPAKTDQSGQFSAYVDLGAPSRYRLRVQDVGSGVKSDPFVLVVRG